MLDKGNAGHGWPCRWKPTGAHPHPPLTSEPPPGWGIDSKKHISVQACANASAKGLTKPFAGGRVGLTVALFLIVAGLTSAVTSWDHEFDE